MKNNALLLILFMACVATNPAQANKWSLSDKSAVASFHSGSSNTIYGIDIIDDSYSTHNPILHLPRHKLGANFENSDVVVNETRFLKDKAPDNPRTKVPDQPLTTCIQQAVKRVSALLNSLLNGFTAWLRAAWTIFQPTKTDN